MKKKAVKLDLVKLVLYILKHCWLLILCAAVGAGYAWQKAQRLPDTYTASGTMYVYNANPNLMNYGYTSSADLNSAVMLVETYRVVVNSNRVLDAVAERLPEYPSITTGYIAGTLSMGSVSETGVVRVSCRTDNPKKSADICNAVLDVAPNEIKRVVGAGDVVIMDYAVAPSRPDSRSALRQILINVLIGAGAAAALLILIFLLNQRVEKPEELEENYTVPLLSTIRRYRGDASDPGRFLLSDQSTMEQFESYAKLRMNLFYTLVGRNHHSVVVTSPISGEGKSTITANLAVSVASMKEKRVLLVDADMRRACQSEVFHYSRKLPGLSDVLVRNVDWHDVLLSWGDTGVEILPAGTMPPNPAELLESEEMRRLIQALERSYDLILLDAPPVNIVADPLALSSSTAGAVLVVRQGLSDHREIQKTLTAAEQTGMPVLGFVFCGEKLKQGKYYSRKYYKTYRNYYNTYDPRRVAGGGAPAEGSAGIPKNGSAGASEDGTADASAEKSTLTGKK